MPTKPLNRLMFVQGGLCFFCKQPLPKAEASVEHLVASANGGGNNDENRVACCKAVNALLGSMSLKEKFQVVLNQKGHFTCPNGMAPDKAGIKAQTPVKLTAIAKSKDEKFEMVVANLRQRGSSKPRTLKTLTSTVVALFKNGLSEMELHALIHQLQARGKVTVTENKVTYSL